MVLIGNKKDFLILFDCIMVPKTRRDPNLAQVIIELHSGSPKVTDPSSSGSGTPHVGTYLESIDSSYPRRSPV
jgi:hypothetical protein